MKSFMITFIKKKGANVMHGIKTKQVQYEQPETDIISYVCWHLNIITVFYIQFKKN